MSLTPSSYFARKFVDVDEGLNYYVNAVNYARRYDDNALIIYESPPTLEHLATLKVAAELVAIQLRSDWKNFHPGLQGVWQVLSWTQKLGTKDDEGYTYCISKRVDHSQFPFQIHCKIFPLMETIAKRVFLWIKKHERMIENVVRRFADELLPAFVWRWDGSVDYNQTDLKLMLGTKLTDEEKFKMMCALCLELDIAELYNSNDGLNTCKANDALMANAHVFYWDGLFADTNPVPPNHYEGSYAKYMLYYHAFSGYARDWYFNACTPEEQRVFCSDLMMKLDSFDVKYLLMGMSEKKQKELFESRVFRCIIDRFLRDNCFDFALQLWNYVKDSMPEYHFITMMKIFVLKTNIGKDHIDQKSKKHQRLEFAIDVWNSTPRHLKEFFIQYENGSLVFAWEKWFNGEHLFNSELDRDNVCVNFCEHYLRDDNLLLAIVSDADAGFRRQFWMDKWPRLMNGSRPRLLRKFMTICLRDLEEIREYKRLILESTAMHYYLRDMFTNFDFDELNLFLDILASDTNQKKLRKTRIIDGLEYFPSPKLMFRKIRNEELHGLADFLREVDEESKMKFLSLWIDEWYARKYIHASLKPRLIYDNMADVLRALCNDQRKQIYNVKMPSYEEFIRKIEIEVDTAGFECWKLEIKNKYSQ